MVLTDGIPPDFHGGFHLFIYTATHHWVQSTVVQYGVLSVLGVISNPNHTHRSFSRISNNFDCPSALQVDTASMPRPSQALRTTFGALPAAQAPRTCTFFSFSFFFFHLTYSRWTSSLPSCLWSQRIFPSLPGSRLTIFLSRCKFSTLTTRQPMVELYLLTFQCFPFRKKEHKSYFGKNRTHDFRTSRCAAYLLDHSGDEVRDAKMSAKMSAKRSVFSGVALFQLWFSKHWSIWRNTIVGGLAEYARLGNHRHPRSLLPLLSPCSLARPKSEPTRPRSWLIAVSRRSRTQPELQRALPRRRHRGRPTP